MLHTVGFHLARVAERGTLNIPVITSMNRVEFTLTLIDRTLLSLLCLLQSRLLPFQFE